MPCRYDDDGSVSAVAAAKLEWGRHAWWPKWEREHRACREGVVLIDMSFMSKFLVQGPDAGAVLDRLSTAAVNYGVEEGTITCVVFFFFCSFLPVSCVPYRALYCTRLVFYIGSLTRSACCTTNPHRNTSFVRCSRALPPHLPQVHAVAQ